MDRESRRWIINRDTIWAADFCFLAVSATLSAAFPAVTESPTSPFYSFGLEPPSQYCCRQTGVRKSVPRAWPAVSRKRETTHSRRIYFHLADKNKTKAYYRRSFVWLHNCFHYSVHSWYPQCRLKEAQLFECGWKWDLLLIALCLRSDSYKCGVIKLEPDCLSVSVNTNATLQAGARAHRSRERGEADLLRKCFTSKSAEPTVKIWGNTGWKSCKSYLSLYEILNTKPENKIYVLFWNHRGKVHFHVHVCKHGLTTSSW